MRGPLQQALTMVPSPTISQIDHNGFRRLEGLAGFQFPFEGTCLYCGAALVGVCLLILLSSKGAGDYKILNNTVFLHTF